MSKAEPRKLEDEDILWAGIKMLPRLDPKRHVRYLRDELGRILCKKYPADACVVTLCPIYDEDCGEHDITICRYGGGCDNVSVKCEHGHSSKEVLEAILREL
jgi:hypothetical protein